MSGEIDPNTIGVPVSPMIEQILVMLGEQSCNALAMFRPNPRQEEFLRGMTEDKLMEAAVTGRNRGGKSLAIFAWYASLLLDEPITMRNGDKLYMRPKRWRGQKMLCWAIGYDWAHVGETVYRLLFEPGAFQMIRDLETKQWRSYDVDRDKDRKMERQPAPPFIRTSMIDPESWAWESKKDRQIRSVRFEKDGTRLVFYASSGAIPQGNPVHAILVDEKIEADALYSECLMRLVDYEGRIVWSSWPTLAPSGAFIGLIDRAEKDIANAPADRKAIAFAFRRGDNPFTENSHLDAALGTMDEDEAAARGDGVMGLARWQMYPRFSRGLHRAMPQEPTPNEEVHDKLAHAIRIGNGIPSDWTRYLILDPGTTNAAVLFVAVPPSSIGDYIVPYDELYLHHAEAEAGELAKRVKAKAFGQFFEDFIADAHAARQTPMGFSGTIGSNYSKHFAANDLRCSRRGTQFSYGSDDIGVRVMDLQGTMNIRPDGTTRLRILGCPVLCKQIEDYRKAADPHGFPMETPAKHQRIDVCVCLEYFASRKDCGYVKPRPPEQVKPPGLRMYEAFLKKHGGDKSGRVQCGPGTA